jgi:hypothetical protein
MLPLHAFALVPGGYLAIPAAYVLLRAAVARRVTLNLAEGERLATNRLDRAFTSSLVEIGINVVLLVVAFAIAQRAEHRESAVLLATTVYMGSVLRGAFNLVVHLADLLDFVRYLLAYRRQGPHRWIAARITPEINRHFDEMRIWLRLLNALGGGPSRRQYVERQTRMILGTVRRKALYLLAIFTTYVIVFRCVAAPVLLEDATGFGPLQAFAWPLVYSVDAFFGSSLSAYVRAADYGGLVRALASGS